MAIETDAELVAERAESMTLVHLTRRDDLKVVLVPQSEAGFDLLVRIQRPSGHSDMLFGVVIQGVAEELSISKANQFLRPLTADTHRKPYHLPTCVFLFTMEDDKGYFTWLTEPSISSGGSPGLTPRPQPNCVELTRRVLDQAVESTTRYYDALATAGLVTPSALPTTQQGVDVLHAIIDEQAEFTSRNGKPPERLVIHPIQAAELAKLGRDHLGNLSDDLVRHGPRYLEKTGLLGMAVKVAPEQTGFRVE